MKVSINGFSCDEVMVLYQFLDYYEKEIKQLKNNKTLNDKLIKEKVVLKSSSSNGNFGNESVNTVVMTKHKKNQLLSFLAHLRNAIAHAYITKSSDDTYSLLDYNGLKINMKGRVSKDVIESIINLIVK